eukprot:comp23115_c2_seq1/m.37223 comp23115_c2_seq1/g.37223  ORF comp23115_c2_seq1/g.37223 comp23115_c2_seq1/m.37223 type:complete len:214 (-) comp23115_c2_seq1:429-1070(-)
MRGNVAGQMSRVPQREDFAERQSVRSTTESLADNMQIPEHIYVGGGSRNAGPRVSPGVRWSMSEAIPESLPNPYESSVSMPTAVPAVSIERRKRRNTHTVQTPVNDPQKPRRCSQPALVPATYEVQWVRANSNRIAEANRVKRKADEEEQMEGVRLLVEEVQGLREEIDVLKMQTSKVNWGLLVVQVVVVVCVARKLLKHWPMDVNFQTLLRA